MGVKGHFLPPLLLRSTEGMPLSELENSWRILFRSSNGYSFQMSSLEDTWNKIIQLKSIHKGTLSSVLTLSHPYFLTYFFPLDSWVSFSTREPRYCCTGHRHRSTLGCLPGTHCWAAELSADTTPLLPQPSRTWSAIRFSFYCSRLEAKACFKEPCLSVRTGFFTAENWIFQHFTCSKHCSHWPLVHLGMGPVGNILVPHFH